MKIAKSPQVINQLREELVSANTDIVAPGHSHEVEEKNINQNMQLNQRACKIAK